MKKCSTVTSTNLKLHSCRGCVKQALKILKFAKSVSVSGCIFLNMLMISSNRYNNKILLKSYNFQIYASKNILSVIFFIQ